MKNFSDQNTSRAMSRRLNCGFITAMQKGTDISSAHFSEPRTQICVDNRCAGTSIYKGVYTNAFNKYSQSVR